MDNFEELLIRIDERFKKLCKSNEDMKIRFVRLEEKIEGKYTSKEEFHPVRNIVFGGTGIILTAVVVALVAIVI